MRLNFSESLWYNAHVHKPKGDDVVQELYHRLLKDMKSIGIPVDFTFELRPYSKTYYGRYDPNSDKITVYVYEDKSCTKMTSYTELLMTSIHEAVHSIQWKDKSFVRRKGVMHNADFYRLYNMYADKAKSILLLREVRHDRVSKTLRGKVSEVYRQYNM